jgi:hypothetical protein
MAETAVSEANILSEILEEATATEDVKNRARFFVCTGGCDDYALFTQLPNETQALRSVWGQEWGRSRECTVGVITA